MRVYLEDGGVMPTRAHQDDAGLDLVTPVDVLLCAGCYERINLKIHCQVPSGYFGMIAGRSSMAARGIYPIGGIIDSGYTGCISVMLMNGSHEDAIIHAGDKIAQLIVIPILHAMPEQTRHPLEATARGDKGFGSTGA